MISRFLPSRAFTHERVTSSHVLTFPSDKANRWKGPPSAEPSRTRTKSDNASGTSGINPASRAEPGKCNERLILAFRWTCFSSSKLESKRTGISFAEEVTHSRAQKRQQLEVSSEGLARDDSAADELQTRGAGDLCLNAAFYKLSICFEMSRYSRSHKTESNGSVFIY